MELCRRGGRRSATLQDHGWEDIMIEGAHVIIYSRDAEADREFLGNALGSPGIDAGDGWLIFALPPAEVAVHPTEGPSGYAFYLTCDDIEQTLADLSARGVEIARPVSDEGWGLLSAVRMPSGTELQLYEPRHSVAYGRA
jgi:Glyoxalase/Bleomycin resistance protein/Dioxygenase superfamily